MKRYTHKFLLTAVAGFICALTLCQKADALPFLSGGITFSGSVTPWDSFGAPTEVLAEATSLDFNTIANGLGTGYQAAVIASSGDFGGSDFVSIFGPLNFSSFPATGISPFYTTSVTGIHFALHSVFVGPVTSTSLALEGTGVFSKAGFFDPTPGIFSLNVNARTGRMDFTMSSTTTGVPDGGSAVALLGFALVGIEAARRKLRLACGA